MDLSTAVAKLTDYARNRLLLDQRDEIYARNTILGILGAESYAAPRVRYEGEDIAVLLHDLCAEAVRLGLIAEENTERVADGVMGALMLSPKAVEEIFHAKRKESPSAATEWFYRYCVDGNYVKKSQLDRNPRFRAGNGLIVTINLTKPEFRDPKTAAKGNSTGSGYPACTICRENEGFLGRNKRTLRTVSITLGGEAWFWQFSPYGYFHQHGIAVNERHIPMHVDRKTFENLMDFVDLFPHYFIGCNAPLPRIGGSVLAHDHFQGGGERLPISDAAAAVEMRHADFPDAEICVLDWYGTAVRIAAADRRSVAALADIVRAGWETYENAAQGLVPRDGDGVHHAVSPTVLKSGKGYEMTLILRSNLTSEAYPDGVFHAHPEFHAIKKESIGLIEAQGLFILPGRLEKDFSVLKECLIKGGGLPAGMEQYDMVFREMKAMGGSFNEVSAQQAVERELASVCERILRNTAVFGTHRETAEFLRGLGFYED